MGMPMKSSYETIIRSPQSVSENKIDLARRQLTFRHFEGALNAAQGGGRIWQLISSIPVSRYKISSLPPRKLSAVNGRAIFDPQDYVAKAYREIARWERCRRETLSWGYSERRRRLMAVREFH